MGGKSVGEGASGRGLRVRRLGSSGVIVLLALMGWSTFGALRADAATVFVQEAFNGSTTASGHWTVPAAPSGNTNIACLTASGATAGTPIPGCQSTALDASGSGALRLTNTGGGEEGGVAYGLSIPTTQGIDATFDTYQYGSNSKADGIALFLAAVNPADPAPVAAIGQPGGSLGYAGSSSTGNGMVDGYLGLGLDVYGNYSNSGFDGSGCSLPSWPGWSGGAVADQVTVRGPGNGTLGYCLLNSTLATDDGGAVALQGSTSQTNDAARTAAEVPVEVVINPGSTTITTGSGLSVPAGDYEIAFTPIGGSRQTLAGPLPTTANGGIPSGLYPSTWMDSTTGLPYQLDFGWVGSTGGSTDIHEVNNVTAQSITTTEVPAFDASLANSPSSVQPDQDLTYTAGVSLASSGNAESDQITVTDVFPTGETPLSAGLGGTNWTCGISGQTDTCTYALAGYPAGTALDALSLPVEVTAAGGTDVTNSFWVSSDDAVSNSAADTITVEAPPGAAATTTALTTGANPTTTGASTTLTATVSTASGTPTGTIDFEDDGTTINGCAAVALSSRVASCVTSFLASGGTPVPLTAVYSGSSSYQTSTGSLSQQVEGATPTISLIELTEHTHLRGEHHSDRHGQHGAHWSPRAHRHRGVRERGQWRQLRRHRRLRRGGHEREWRCHVCHQPPRQRLRLSPGGGLLGRRQLRHGDQRRPGPGGEQGNPDDHLHQRLPLAGVLRQHLHGDCDRGWVDQPRPLHQRHHVGVHRDRLAGQLRRCGHLHHRCQPGGGRQLQRGFPGASIIHRQQGAELLHGIGQPDRPCSRQPGHALGLRTGRGRHRHRDLRDRRDHVVHGDGQLGLRLLHDGRSPCRRHSECHRHLWGRH